MTWDRHKIGGSAKPFDIYIYLNILTVNYYFKRFVIHYLGQDVVLK